MPDRQRNESRAASDRRTSPRYRTRALTNGSVVAASPARGPSFLGTTVNVSSGGALVRTYEALVAGQELTLTMHLPEGDLKVAATVLHVEQDAVGCRLAGVRFAPLGNEPAGLLARHLRSFDSQAGAPQVAAANPVATPAPAASAGTPAATPAASATPPPPAPSENSPLRKSLRDVRQKTTVVFPFEGQIHRP